MERLLRRFAAELCGQGIHGNALQFDAKKVRRQVALILDRVTFKHPWADTEGTRLGWRAMDRKSTGPFMCDVNNAAVVQVNIDRRGSGMVMHRDEFVRTIVDSLHEHICVVQDDFVVGRQWRWTLREACRHKQHAGKFAANTHGFELTLLNDLHSAAAEQGFDLLDKGDIRSDGHAVRFHVHGELVGLFEAEHQFAIAGGSGEDGVQLGE